ncbi:hypothetical protein GM418_20855 [Maribellus comscasis]|uniref:FHA domain-containing protein n=1 Tax=Maribellus comscasis TaxID=2681766 RepID=A0A6I6JYD3_9BACT|nr:hypothetical protein GM418_20855 [Maribellus comscasis]
MGGRLFRFVSRVHCSFKRQSKTFFLLDNRNGTCTICLQQRVQRKQIVV